jgi:hypothetical protein
VRRLVELRGLGRGLARDRQHRVAEVVQPLLRLGLGRLDHQRLGHDQREVDRRRVDPVVHQALGDVESGDAVLALQRARREDELVHAQTVEGQVVGVPQPREEVVGVQDGGLAHLAELRAVRADVGVRAHEDPEGAGERPDLADRERPIEVEPEAVLLPADDRRNG